MNILTKQATEIFHYGMNFGFAAPRGWYGSDEGLAQVGKMKDLNINWVAAHVTVVQEAYYSSRIYQDFEHTPADEELITWIATAHAAGIKVMLKPIVEPLDGTWRGIIVPPNDAHVFGSAEPGYKKNWVASLTHMLTHYAKVAAKAEADTLCLGSEYHRVDGWNKEWRSVLNAVRGEYAGPVTYEFVPHSLRERKLYPDIGEWWSELDYLGYSTYPSTKRGNATVEDFAEAMQGERQVVADLQKMFGLPVVLAEIGCRSSASGAANAAGFRDEGRFDGGVQARYLEAVCRVFKAEPACRGIYWWKWDEHQKSKRPNYYTDPAGDQGFTIEGKTAAEVLKNFYGR